MVESNASGQSGNHTGHELSDLSPRGIGLFGFGLALILVFVMYAISVLLGWFRSSEIRLQAPPNSLLRTLESAPKPRLEVEAGRELKEMRRQAEQRLTQYGWIDREKGIVHIPIVRAMELIEQKRRSSRPGNNGSADRERKATSTTAAREGS